MERNEDLESLAREVKVMRDMQRSYFAEKIGLDQCKWQEARVDKIIQAVLSPPLFKDPEPGDGGW